MIVKDDDAIKRLNSPLNLINQLQSITRSNGNKNKSKSEAMALFGIGRKREKKGKEVYADGISVNASAITGENTHPVKNTIFNLFKEEQSAKQTPSLDTILENHESQIKLGLAHDAALALLNNSINLLSEKLDDVNASKLPSVIAAASKTVESIRRERNEAAKNGKDREVHYHFYTPEQKKISDYEVIDVA